MLTCKLDLKELWYNPKNTDTKRKYRMVSLEPISSKYCEISRRRGEWHGNHGAAENPDSTKTSGSLVKCERREVEVASDLIFGLHHISEVATRWNRAGCSVNPVLPWALSLLQPVPRKINTLRLVSFGFSTMSYHLLDWKCKLFMIWSFTIFDLLW